MRVGFPHQQVLAAVALAAGWWLASPGPGSEALQTAYIGPGAGFAFLGSFLAILGGFFLTGLSLVSWPFRLAWRAVRSRRVWKRARVRKLIFLGLDGFDAARTERLLAEGKLPHLARLRELGGYRRLRTTFPSLSPVAWSTFATGVNPARHNIFDFLNRNLKSYLPELSSAKVGPPSRVLRIGRWRLPLARPYLELRRKSQPFWKILGQHHISATILRVPITFPPEKFRGRLLSAMCTPDLKGTQGSFAQFTTRLEQANFESGARYPLRRRGSVLEGELEGPEDFHLEGRGALKIPFRLELDGAGARLQLGGRSYRLRLGEYTPWIRLTFRNALGAKVRGIARFLLTELEPHVSLYVSPVNLDPERPALPIAHPSFYAAYLAKLIGPYATLGMAEDTWALNEGVIDEEAFLEQAYLIFEERKAMFLSALERTRRGVVACVFDTSDRIQHMFYRHLGGNGRFAHVIDEMYQRMDQLVGETLRYVDDDTVLFVLSDHGFCSFRRAVNLNTWLWRHGYLVVKPEASLGPYFQGVDWSRTRAYCLGLGGLYLNLRGREACGVVSPGEEAERLKAELIEKLTGLRDDETGQLAIRQVYAASDLYTGPYLEAAPDLIVGYNEGYRIAWEAAVGHVGAEIFTDNRKAWSGDHCVDPHLVPGVLFSNRPIHAPSPGIEDMAPTALELFGLQPPSWMEGRPVLACTSSGRSTTR
ncbi:MAG: alkaline phosphatase family protein [Bryobacterales bacterium]|nr:alkaline phosphatase family protein [Bryobacteraceae bacterium]MDW8355804.1 alkaline phosphatase family protein [Bryobacterales bacterium]